MRTGYQNTGQAEKHHNWDDYAQRTARYAFSAKAERDVETLGKYRLQWEELEEREIEIENVMEITIEIRVSIGN